MTFFDIEASQAENFERWKEEHDEQVRTKVLEEIWIDAINKFDETLNLEDLDELLKAHKNNKE